MTRRSISGEISQSFTALITLFPTHLNCDLNFVMKSPRKRPLLKRPRSPNWTFPLFLALVSDQSESLHINQQFNEIAHCANGSLIKILYSAV